MSGARDIAGSDSSPRGKAAPTPVNTPLNAAPISQGLSGPTVPETIDESKSDDDLEEADVDPTAQAIFSLVQGRLASLVGRTSGYVENLPAKVKRRVEGLKGVQAEYTKLEAQMKREQLELEKKYLALYTPIFDHRRAILAGEVEPTDEEVAAGEAITAEDKEEEEEDELADSVAKLALSKSKKTDEKADDETDEDVKGVPEFWSTALRNHSELQTLISERDEEALVFLHDVKLAYLQEPELGFKIVFQFNENPFFENKELEKTYYYQKELGYTGDYIYQRAAGTSIKWKEDKDLTKTVEIKKQRNKNTNRTRLVRRTQNVPSFFDFFTPPLPLSSDPDLIERGLAVDEEELEAEEAAELEEKMELDYQLGEDFKEKIIPRAVDYFTGKALRFEQDFSDLGDSETSSSNESTTSDSDSGAPRRAPAPKKKGEAEKAEECKNQ